MLNAFKKDSECGSITAMFVILLVVLFAVLAVVVDGGRQLSSEINATNLANQAAREGAAQLRVSYLRQDQVVINSEKAISAAQNFLKVSGHPGVAWVVGNTVYVRVTYSIPTLLSSIIGINSLKISATGSAVNVAGIGPTL